LIHSHSMVESDGLKLFARDGVNGLVCSSFVHLLPIEAKRFCRIWIVPKLPQLPLQRINWLRLIVSELKSELKVGARSSQQYLVPRIFAFVWFGSIERPMVCP
jgi:hypothetical protein